MLRSTTAPGTTRLFVAAMAALAAIGLAACSTPTLPLPPPAALSASEPDADGLVTIEGEVLENAYVFLLNEELERGVIVRADGSGRFVARIEAADGHFITIWQRRGNDVGEQVSIGIPYP